MSEKKFEAQELSDRDLDKVSGGYFTYEEWTSMTYEEQIAAEAESWEIRMVQKDETKYCKYYDPTPANQ